MPSGILPRVMATSPIQRWMTSLWIPRAAAATGLAGLVILYLASQRTFTLEVNGQSTLISTHAVNVALALQDAGLALQPGDVVYPDLNSKLTQGMTIEVRRAFPVDVVAAGQRKTIRSAEIVPENILALAGVRVYPGDRVLADGVPVINPAAPLPYPPHRMEWSPGTDVTIDTGAGEIRVRTSAVTVGGALEAAGIELYQADSIQPGPSTPLVGPMTVAIKRSRGVEIKVDGETIKARTSAFTVGEALSQAGVSLVGLDYAEPAVDHPLPADAKIRVVRVLEQVRVELTPVPFETQYQPLSDVELDQQKLIKAGAYGVEAHQVRVRYEDGKESGRIEEGSWLAKAADPRIVGYGTNIVIRKVSTGDGTIEYWRAVQMWATSYSASRAGVSPDAPNFGITASGRPLTKGLVAIDRRYIPFGTQMYVPGYGYALAADTGSGVNGRWIDLGYDDDNWVSWHQYVTVYFLTPVPPEGSIVWIFPP